MKQCKKILCFAEMSEGSPVYCPEHNQFNKLSKERIKAIAKYMQIIFKQTGGSSINAMDLIVYFAEDLKEIKP